MAREQLELNYISWLHVTINCKIRKMYTYPVFYTQYYCVLEK